MTSQKANLVPILRRNINLSDGRRREEKARSAFARLFRVQPAGPEPTTTRAGWHFGSCARNAMNARPGCPIARSGSAAARMTGSRQTRQKRLERNPRRAPRTIDRMERPRREKTRAPSAKKAFNEIVPGLDSTQRRFLRRTRREQANRTEAA